ncbi:hypothetical protein [Halorarius litoreus]|uniref:hypothetical protein n=1 Tax=Halorarius litoreus TaxID=2962676 RepID=UPI0020CD2E97|nr:hypothetical protein [Halorarius litoreus]
MSTHPSATPPAVDHETVSYADVRAVILPEGPDHYEVDLADETTTAHHAVERVVLNNTVVRFDDPLWFIDVNVDVGLPLYDHGDTVWVWL